MSGKALEGVKVLEYAGFVSGPYCSKLLADLGAEVIKIEKPEAGDEARKRGPFPGDIPHPEKSGLFLYLNTNKLGVTLDPETTTGKGIFLELVKWADILIEDKSPKKVEELGFSYESLKEINPRLIMTSITPFGEFGPYRDYKGYHLNVVHASGSGYLLPTSTNLEREPLKAGGHFDDCSCGLSAAIATLGALYWRGATGSGQHIDCSKQDMIMDLEKVMITIYANADAISSRVPVSSVMGMCNLPCTDGYIMFAYMMKSHLMGLFDAMGNPEYLEKFRDDDYRDEHIQEFQNHIAEWARNGTREELYNEAQKRGVPTGIVRSTEEVLAWEQPKAREFFVEVNHPEAGRVKYPTAAYRLSGTPVAIDHPAPLLGEHNEEVYCERLGYTRQDLVKMKEAGVI